MNFNSKDFKLYCLSEEYTKYNNVMNNIQKHIKYLYKNNIINISDINLGLSNIYETIYKINIIRENIIDNCEDDFNLDSSFDNIFKNVTPANSNSYLYFYNYLKSIFILPSLLHDSIPGLKILLDENILYPFDRIRVNIIDIIEMVGIKNITDIFKILKVGLSEFDNNSNNLLKMYSELFIPISVNILESYKFDDNDLNIIKDNSFFSKHILIKSNSDGKHDELLDNYFTIYINIRNIWLKINGYFNLDPLQINIRLMPSNLDCYRNIFNRKLDIDRLLGDNDKFKKKYLKYCSIQELIMMPTNKFISYLDIKYKRFIELNNKSFPSLMKEFIGKTINLFSWYETIKLLLLGSEENINVAGSLYSLLKDKKTNMTMVSDIIYDNLVFCNQMKLKKINNTLKIELDKLNELNFDSIDLKKELARSTHIPLYIRAFAMEKINEMKLNNSDYNKQLIYVKTILQFPWPSQNDENIFQNLHNSDDDAKKFILDIDSKLDKITYGHKKVKEHISLLITKWISNPFSAGSAIGLVGPPGVGKTLIAKSLAKVLDIPMIMITLGGQNDAELLIGHGYTYSGAQPGMIIKKMCEASQGRCIMYFDELDKSCAKHGSVNEITSILIHLTDPNTNKTFQDRFFQGIDFPLDKVIFIASYNDSSKIDPILLDRIVELEVKPYNINDKINILKNFIIPELKTNIGINKSINFNDDDIKRIIYNFTSESGVRDLKHKMEQVLLNINKKDLFNRTESDTIVLNYDIILEILGSKNINHFKKINATNRVGSVNGLYATTTGNGGITCIEICPIRISDNNNFQLKLTGSMGDVMKESIQVAFTRACNFINDNKAKYNIENINDYIKTNYPWGFHIHTPDGATPKDGPSAGAAFTVCFISAILNIPTNRYVAMTGEMNLFGHVTKIGGLNYKLIGAKYADVKTVLVPKENETDLLEIAETNPDLFCETFKYIIVSNINEVVDNVLDL